MLSDSGSLVKSKSSALKFSTYVICLGLGCHLFFLILVKLPSHFWELKKKIEEKVSFVGMRGDCRFLVSLQLQYNQNFKFCSVQHFVRSIFSPFSSKFGSVVISFWTLWSAFAHCRLSGGISSLLGPTLHDSLPCSLVPRGVFPLRHS